jgi:uncharacterized membrane protein (DUF373 family)
MSENNSVSVGKARNIRNFTKDWLDNVSHIIELFVAGLVLLFSAVLAVHLLWAFWQVIASFRYGETPLAIRTVVTEALDLLIMLEITQIFLRLEVSQKIGIKLILDTAILFSVRETIVRLYGGHEHLVVTEFAVVLFVALRVLYGLVTDKKPELPRLYP